MNILSQTSIKSEESLAGFLLRTSDFANYQKLNWITQLGDHNASHTGGITNIASHIAGFCDHLADDEATLREHGYIAAGAFNGPISGFGGQVFIRNLLNTNHSRICSDCLKEEGIHKQIWDLALYTCCPKHARDLLTHCPECEAPISWNRSKLQFCDCGCDFREATAIPSDPASLKLALKIEEAAANGSLMHLHQVICFVGWSAKIFPEKDLRSLSQTPSNQIKTLVNSVANILYKNWPSSWFPILEANRSDRIARGYSAIGLRSVFGPLYEHLYATANEAAFLDLRSAFEGYLTEYDLDKLVTNRGGSLIGKQSNGTQYLTKEKTREEMAIGKGKLKWLIDHKFLNPYTIKMGNQLLHKISMSDIQTAKVYLAGILSAKEAAKRLGITLPATLKLLESKKLRARRGPLVDKYNRWEIHIDDIKMYLAVS